MNKQIIRELKIDNRLTVRLFSETWNGEWEERWEVELDGKIYNRIFQHVDTALIWAVSLRNGKIRHAESACFVAGAPEI